MPPITLDPEAPPSLSDQIALFHSMAQFMKSGIPLVAGLAHAEEQVSSRMRPVLEGIRHALEVRHLPLAQAFREHYPGRDAFLFALLEQGEAAGTLDESFRQLERVAKLRQERLRKLARGLAYPFLVLIAVLAIWPVPVGFREGLDAYLIRAVPPLAVVFAALYFAIFVWPRARLEPEFARGLDRQLMRLKPYRAGLVARFARALGLLVKSGLALDRAVALAGAATGSPLFELRLKTVASEIRGGRPLSELLAPLGDILPAAFISMLKTGEQTGALDTVLERAAEMYEEESDQAQSLALTLAGPGFNIVVLLIGGYFVISAYQGYLDNLGSILR